FSSRRRHTRCYRDWSSDVCSSDLIVLEQGEPVGGGDDLAGGIGGGPDPGDDGEVFAAIGDLVPIRQRARGEERGLREGAAEQEQIGRASCRERVKRGGGGGSEEEI